MRERVPSAVCQGVARLADFRLTLDKRGADGSGKANLRAAPGEAVFGVVYAIDPDHWGALDRFEPDYMRIAVAIDLAGASVAAQTYRSERTAREAVCFAAYKRLIVEGAREHSLPDDWQRWLATLPARDDPRRRTR